MGNPYEQRNVDKLIYQLASGDPFANCDPRYVFAEDYEHFMQEAADVMKGMMSELEYLRDQWSYAVELLRDRQPINGSAVNGSSEDELLMFEECHAYKPIYITYSKVQDLNFYLRREAE